VLVLLAALAGCAAGDRGDRAPESRPPDPATDAPAPEDDTTPPGRWRRQRPTTGPPEIEQRIRELEAIGYVGGSREAPSAAGVTIHDPARAFSGVNLYTSGHAAEALLVGMDGEVLKRWRADYRAIWPDSDVAADNENTRFLRRARLGDDGELLAIFEGLGLVKLDRDSRVVWAAPNKAHHDLDVGPDGEILVLTRAARLVPRIDANEPILEDFVTVLGPDGGERKRVSILESFERSPEHRGIVESLRRRRGDVMHTNTLHLLDGRLAGAHPAFARGNVLVSSRWLDVIAIVDLAREEVVWAWRGEFRRQHDPKILDNGHLLLFNNEKSASVSSVMELDPIGRRLVWEYAGSADAPLYSLSCGAAERLPNGNTLITESDNGRAIEVTPEGTIVWEFVNPHRAGPDGTYVATLFELVRLPARGSFDPSSSPSSSGSSRTGGRP
jgi:hypothetical protein